MRLTKKIFDVPLNETEKVEILEELTVLDSERNQKEYEKKAESERVKNLTKQIEAIDAQMGKLYKENRTGVRKKEFDCFVYFDTQEGVKTYYNAETAEVLDVVELTDEEIEQLTTPQDIDPKLFDDSNEELAIVFGIDPGLFGEYLAGKQISKDKELILFIKEHENMITDFPDLKNFIGRAKSPFEENEYTYFFSRKLPEKVEDVTNNKDLQLPVQEENEVETTNEC